jgi:hypothetical protein
MVGTYVLKRDHQVWLEQEARKVQAHSFLQQSILMGDNSLLWDLTHSMWPALIHSWEWSPPVTWSPSTRSQFLKLPLPQPHCTGSQASNNEPSENTPKPYPNHSTKSGCDGKVIICNPGRGSSPTLNLPVKGIGGLSGPQPPCWRNQYQTSHVDKISNVAGLS